MRQRIRNWLFALLRRTEPPPPDQRTVIRKLNDALVDLAGRDNNARTAYAERIAELVEARQMAGAGPWSVSPAALAGTDRIISDALERFGKPAPRLQLAESGNAITAQGAYGDIELALQNVEWRREVNLSWLEFSRWGIQQLILICRLYYIKHPWIRRGINLSAAYVFGQGVELSSPDPDANETLKEFRERNRGALGQIALVEAEKRKSYDGNLFWCLFSDTQDTGTVNVRLIDATEIQEIWSDPDDADKPWYYRRVWTQRTPDPISGQMKNTTGECWYPALNYEPTPKPPTIGKIPVQWESPVYHRKVGCVANWTFGCPRVYPGIDWAKEGRKYLEACAAKAAALGQIALTITTKGGQQALMGIKEQIGTTVGPSSALWDKNPPAVAGSTFASGPGTKLEPLMTRGAGADPSEVKEYRNMVACALMIPPTWLADMETSNLSTAETLDRPTELGFELLQEEWQEDLVVMGQYALKVSNGAPSGRFKAALARRAQSGDIVIREAARSVRNGHWVYEASKAPKPDVVEVMCSFPAIREGDIPALIHATNEAMAIDRQGNQHGLDDRTAVRKFCGLLDIPHADELVEKLFPEASYNLDRTIASDEGTIPDPAPVAVPGAKPTAVPAKEATRIREALRRVSAALVARESPQSRVSYPRKVDGAEPENSPTIISMREYSADQERVPAGGPGGGEFAGGSGGYEENRGERQVHGPGSALKSGNIGDSTPVSKAQARLLALNGLPKGESYAHAADMLTRAGHHGSAIPPGHTWRSAGKLADHELLSQTKIEFPSGDEAKMEW
jgi:hypothetical protein